MNIEPIKKSFVDRAKALGATDIQLKFSGGSDEGFLEVELGGIEYQPNRPAAESRAIDELKGDIEDWAWENYDYSGAGDGSDYGDDITYDFTNNKATHAEWSMRRHDADEDESELPIADDSDEVEEDDEPKRDDSAILDDLIQALDEQEDGYLSPKVRDLIAEAKGEK